MTTPGKLDPRIEAAIRELPGMYNADTNNLLSDAALGKNPYHLLTTYFASCGHSGPSLFGLAGMTGVPPRMLWRDLTTTSRGNGLCVGYCSATALPIMGCIWSDYGTKTFKNYHLEELTDEGDNPEDDFPPFEEDENYCYYPTKDDPRRIENMLKRFGGLNWKRHCTRTFNPFDKSAAHLNEGQWTAARKLALTWKKVYRRRA